MLVSFVAVPIEQPPLSLNRHRPEHLEASAAHNPPIRTTPHTHVTLSTSANSPFAHTP